MATPRWRPRSRPATWATKTMSRGPATKHNRWTVPPHPIRTLPDGVDPAAAVAVTARAAEARRRQACRAGCGALAGAAPSSDGAGELAQHRHRHLPAHARVGDGLAVAKCRPIRHDVLTSVFQEAFHHHAEDCRLAVRQLRRNLVHDP